MSLPTWARAAAVAYSVLGLFGIAYFGVSQLRDDLSSSATAVVAAVIAAPLAFGVVWPRLTGVSAFGIEVSLSQLTVQLDTQLAAAIMSRDVGSREPHLVAQMETILQPGVELLEVDLRDGSYWLSTRLFLLAALAQDLSNVRAFVFLGGATERRFVGIATASVVRSALACQAPELERTYLDIARDSPIAGPPSERVRHIVYSWTTRLFGSAALLDFDFGSRVSANGLCQALNAIGSPLHMDSVDWPGYADSRLVRALIRDFKRPYVALIRMGSFDRIINRLALAAEVAGQSD